MESHASILIDDEDEDMDDSKEPADKPTPSEDDLTEKEKRRLILCLVAN